MLNALVFKSLCLTRRQYFVSIFSFLWPCLVFMILIRCFLSDKQSSLSLRQEKMIYPLMQKFLLSTSSIVYTPRNKFTEKLMNNIKMKNSSVNIHSLEKEADIEKWFSVNQIQISNHTDDVTPYYRFGVVFNVLENATEPPLNFIYAIRTDNFVSTDILFPKHQVPGPMEAGDLYIRDGFAALKVSLDEAFLKEVGVDKVNWSMQEFPYPSYETYDVSEELIYKTLLPSFLLLCFTYLWIQAAQLYFIEKMSGMIERMRLCGMNDFYIVLNYLLHPIPSVVISTCLITILLIVPTVRNRAMLESSNFLILWTMLLLLSLHSILYFLAVSSFFNNATLRQVVVNGSYMIIYFLVLSSFMNSSLSVVAKIFGNMIAPFSLVHISVAIVRLNFEIEHPLSGFDDSDLPLIVIAVCMIFGSVINVCIFMYMLHVNPGLYGSAKPFYFILPKKLSSLLKISPAPPNSDNNERNFRSGIYENVSDNIVVGLQIRNLYKKYGLFTSVQNLSLDIFEGQITVLLGHNGAGKTTTLSMLSGLLSPSSGSTLYKGYDIFTNLKAFRKDLGLCPQNDLLHVNLSVDEHLIFFGMLKGFSKREAHEQANVISKEVGLSNKKNSVIKELSGGMKRKLCIALAMIGKPKVVILDEPTSGLDPESRREIWNILLKSRGERMMLISTHFMEEADVLGDQIAIMNHGKISCYGTPLFLKKLYGAGYHITVSYSSNRVSYPEKRNSLIQIVTSKIPEATILNENEEFIKFNLPFSEEEKFSELFKSLETNFLTSLEISRIGINCTTMEDVFLKVQEEAGTTGTQTSEDMVKELSRTANQTDNGSKVYIERFLALVIKNIKSTTRRWFPSLLVLILVPVVLSYGAINPLYKYAFKYSETSNLFFDLSIYGPSEVLVYGGENSVMKNAFLSLVQSEGSSSLNVPEVSSSNVIEELLKIGAADEMKYRKSMIVAADFSGSSPKFLYSSIANHAPIIALNLLYNTILKSSNITSRYAIKTSSHPVGSSLELCESIDNSEYIAIITWVATFSFTLMIICSYFIKYVHEERISSLKHLILMSSVSPVCYWMSFFIWDFTCYFVSISLILISFLIIGSADIFNIDNGISMLLLIFLLFGFSMIWMTYLITFVFKNSTSVLAMYYSVVIISGYILFGVYIVIPQQYENYAIILKFHPATALMLAMFHFTSAVLQKLKCTHCSPDSIKGIDCYEVLHSSYFVKDINNSLIVLGTIWILFFIVIILKDFGVISFLWNKYKSTYLGHVEAFNARNVESDVAKEKDRVDAVRNLTDEERAPAVIVDGLAKKYSRSVTAVYDVSFTCNEGECFGLLGVNGAGKTTTFNIICGKMLPTQGNALIKGYSLKNNRRKCLSFMGYCPQFSALIDYLTGEEMLTLFAKLRLVPSQNVESTVKYWIHVLGLIEYYNKACGIYSGGNKRKLSTALAFIGNPNIILLDEPSTGVDPMIRKNLWDVIDKCANKKQAIIISSHSMDECEAVCKRLTIMSEGRMQCIGSVQHLKSLYGQGHVIMIKLNIQFKTQLAALKQEILLIFESKCVLKDEHQGLLHYLIETQFYQLSFLFGSMESLKKKFDIINDYMISDSSLEQIFLSFGKKQKM